MRLSDRRDAGFTLIELLVAVTIVAVIAVPLGNVIIGFLRNANDTTDRIDLSHDAQISATYFARDVAAVGIRDLTAAPDASGNLPFRPSIQVNAGYAAGGHTCGPATTPQALVRFLSDRWDTSVTPTALITDVTAYYLLPVTGGVELHRIRCAGPSIPPSDATLANFVDPATVSLTCSSTCTGAAVPQQVTLSFSVRTRGSDAYPIVLTGQRRQT